MFKQLKDDVKHVWNNWKGAALVYFGAGAFALFVLAGLGLKAAGGQ